MASASRTTDRGTLALGLGANATALGVAASWICCLPLTLSGLGAGTAALGAALVPVRPYLSLVSLTLLAAAFWASRGSRAPAGTACPSGTRARHRVGLWALTGLAALLLTTEYWLSWLIYWSL